MATEILDFTDDMFMRQVKQAQSLVSNIQQYKKFYNEELSKVDLEQQDILHYIQIREKVSGAELLKAASALRKIRRKRDVIKRKQYYAGVLAGDFSNAKCKTILGFFKDPMNESRAKEKYHVRTNILKEVFGYEGKNLE